VLSRLQYNIMRTLYNPFTFFYQNYMPYRCILYMIAAIIVGLSKVGGGVDVFVTDHCSQHRAPRSLPSLRSVFVETILE
jgi:hypothetical protein